MGSYSNIYPMLKMSGNLKLAMELGRVPEGGLNITLRPKNLIQWLVDALKQSPLQTRFVAIFVATL